MLQLPMHLLIITCVALLAACGPGEGGDTASPTTTQEDGAGTTTNGQAGDDTAAGDDPAAIDEGPAAPAGEDLVGEGDEIGVKARTVLAVGSYSDMSSFERHGIEVGASSGTCHVPDPDPVRADIAAAVEQSDPKAGEVTLSRDDLLVGRCGDQWYALASWDSDGSMTLDQFSAAAGGPWEPSAEGKYPGCEGPADLAKVWEIDRSYCTGA